MSTAALQYHRAKHGIVSLRAININWKIIYVLAAVIASLLLFFYIFRVNELTRGAFLIKTYNKQITGLLQENRSLQSSVTESGFLGQIQEKAKELSFEKTAGVTYLKILQNSLAEVPKNHQK